MKTISLIIMLTVLGMQHSKACDICGCGVGSSYIGILPDFSKKIIGLRYRYNSLTTHIGAGGAITYLTTDETYQTAELWGGWTIKNKIRLMASAPYAFNERENQGIKHSKDGLGDISLTGYYQLINSRKTIDTTKLLVQSLWVGGGAKLPTGRYNPADKSNSSNNTNLFQLGTASWDFTLNAMYDIRLQDIGLNVTVAYKMNSENKHGYQYGNKLNTSGQLYYKFRINNNFILAPNVGIQYETANKDMDSKFEVDVSGGRLTLFAAGAETVVYKKISAGINWQTVLSQNLADGFVKSGTRLMTHVSFVF